MIYLWKLLSGWKLVLGYFLLNIPGLTPNPLWATAVSDIATSLNPQTIASLVANIIALIGMIDKIRRNIQSNGANERNP